MTKIDSYLGLNDYFGTTDFEIEQLITRDSITQLLDEDSGLKIRLCIHGNCIEFPKLGSPEMEVESDEDENPINEQGDAPNYFPPTLNLEKLTISVDSVFADKFPHLLNETLYSSVLRNGTLRGKYSDAVIKAKDGHSTLVLPTHRVLLAGK